jgi:phosphoserine phosphatase
VSSTVLVRVSALDRPGITAGLMGVLEAGGAVLLDVEQIVVRGRLTLDILIDVPPGNTIIKDLLFYGWEHDLRLDFEVVEDAPSEYRTRSAVTIIGREVGPAVLGAVAGAIASGNGNIDRIFRLSRYPVIAYELAITDGDIDVMRRALVEVAAATPVDIAIQPEGLHRRGRRLVVMDVDSTLIQNEMIDLLAEEAGVADEVAAITARAMEGDIDFETALRDRVRLLVGLPVSAIDRVADKIVLTPGARTFVATLKKLGMRVGVVSGGFTVFTDRLKDRLDLDHAEANELEISEGLLTGRLVGRVVGRERKAEILRELAEASGVPLEQTVAIGDGANDLDLLAAAGLGIAFNAKPVVRDAADTSLNVPYLDAALFLLGIPRQDISGTDDT